MQELACPFHRGWCDCKKEPPQGEVVLETYDDLGTVLAVLREDDLGATFSDGEEEHDHLCPLCGEEFVCYDLDCSQSSEEGDDWVLECPECLE